MPSLTFTMPDGSKQNVAVPEGMDPHAPETQAALFRQLGTGANAAPGPGTPPGGLPPSSPRSGSSQGLDSYAGIQNAIDTTQLPPNFKRGMTPSTTPMSSTTSTTQPGAMPPPQQNDPMAFLTAPQQPVSVQGETPPPDLPGGPLIDALQRRTLDNARTLGDPNAPFIKKLGAAGALAMYATQPEMLAGGSLLEAGLRSMSSKDTAAALSDIAEGGYALTGPVRAAVSTYRAGKGIVQAGLSALAGVPRDVGVAPREAVMGSLSSDVQDVLGLRNKQIGEIFDNVESNFTRRMPAIPKGAPGYDDVADVVRRATDSGAPMPGGEVGGILTKLADDVKNGRALDTQTVINLRKGLNRLARGSGDPTTDQIARFSAELHGELSNAYRTAMPNDLQQTFAQAQNAWRTQYFEPRMALAKLYNPHSSAVDAFNEVFNLNDPRAFRAVAGMVGDNPGIATKLRAGFIDSLRQISGDFQDAKSLVRPGGLLDNAQGPMTELGIMSSSDFVTMRRMFQAQAQGTLMRNLGSLAQYARIGGAAAAAHYFTHDPATMIGAAVAAGALPEMRKIMLLTAGTPAFQRAALALGTKLTQAAGALQENARRAENPDQLENHRGLWGAVSPSAAPAATPGNVARLF